MNLPERINVMKVISYDVQQICEDIHAAHEIPFDEISIEDCMEFISDWVVEDFGYDDDLIYQDENGEEL